MDHINLFQTNAEFLSAYTNDYVEPWVSFTMENSGMSFNKVQAHDYSQDYLTFELIDGGDISSYDDYMLFSVDDGNTWVDEITGLTPGAKVIAKSDVIPYIGSESPLSTTGRFNIEGNILSIYDPIGFRTRTTLDGDETFENLFARCTYLISAENLILPLTALTNNCYCSMFSDCRNLIVAPELPATTLTNACYSGMFSGCDSLTTAPELPATMLVDYCYQCMFQSCTNLNYIKCLATDISANDCTYNWVNGVSSTGTFVKPSATDWSLKTDYDGIPDNWTVEDAS